MSFGDRDTVSAFGRLARARRLGATAGRVYLGFKAHRLLERRVAPAEMRGRWRRFHRESAEVVYRTAVDLQGLVLKGCQYLGARADVLPRPWTEVLSALQDRVPPRPFSIVRHTVERELGRPLESVFPRFSETPVASASLAQVHEAVRADGRRVAVKVQYPEIERLVRSDLASLRMLLRAIGWLERDLDLLPLLEELRELVPRELDFRLEADSAERIAERFTGRDDVRVPDVHRDLSTRRLLVLEFVDGIKITDRAALARANVDLERLARVLVETYAEQILSHGFFHADPHPGNLLVEPASGRLVLLDFGLAKELPPGFRAEVVALLGRLLDRDVAGAAAALERLGFAARGGRRECLLPFAQVLVAVAGELAENGPLSPHAFERISETLGERLRESPIVHVPAHALLLARTLGLLSGVSRSLGVQLDPLQVALPYAFAAPPARRGRKPRPEPPHAVC